MLPMDPLPVRVNNPKAADAILAVCRKGKRTLAAARRLDVIHSTSLPFFYIYVETSARRKSFQITPVLWNSSSIYLTLNDASVARAKSLFFTQQQRRFFEEYVSAVKWYYQNCRS